MPPSHFYEKRINNNLRKNKKTLRQHPLGSIPIVPTLPALLKTLTVLLASLADGQPPVQSPECKAAATNCENATDCVHRLAVLQSACVTNTCQPQCREAALNLYQNREGRALLRTDASCVPGRYELEKCGLLPAKVPKHCLLAKLICEIDLQCNAKWEVFRSECESSSNNNNNNELRRCSDKCRRHLNATLATQHGSAFSTCTCTDKEDGRCTQLRDSTLHPCLSLATTTTAEEEGPLPRPSLRPRPSTGDGKDHGMGEEEPEKEEEGDEDELNSNRIVPKHDGSSGEISSQSDVPTGAAAATRVSGNEGGGGVFLLLLLLLPSLFLALATACALQ